MISIISQKVTSWNHTISTVHHDTHVNIIVYYDVLESKDVDKAIKVVGDIWYTSMFYVFDVIIVLKSHEKSQQSHWKYTNTNLGAHVGGGRWQKS